jgi:putative FmdB family regulatory protein
MKVFVWLARVNMPSYDYECLKCNHVENVFKKMSEPHPTICTRCGEDTLVRLYNSAPTVEFKGKGWMKTDGKY